MNVKIIREWAESYQDYRFCIYKDNMFTHSFKSQKEAIEFVESQINIWRKKEDPVIVWQRDY